MLAQGFHRFLVAVGVLLFAPFAHPRYIANAQADDASLDQADRQGYGRLRNPNPEDDVITGLLGGNVGLLQSQAGLFVSGQWGVSI